MELMVITSTFLLWPGEGGCFKATSWNQREQFIEHFKWQEPTGLSAARKSTLRRRVWQKGQLLKIASIKTHPFPMSVVMHDVTVPCRPIPSPLPKPASG